MPVTCQRERFADVLTEIALLVDDHWQEVGSFKQEFRRHIDYPAYLRMADLGKLLTVTARADGRMVGYVVGVLGNDLHRITLSDPARHIVTMTYLLYYVCPDKRGHAVALIRTAEREAERVGVQIVSTRVKPGLNAADAFFAKIGYEPIEVTLTKLIGDAAHAARSRAKVD